MASRIDIPAIIVVLGFLLIAISFVSPAPNSSIGWLVAFSIPIALYSYAAYWGLTIRRGLGGWIYRNQAFGISLLCLIFVFDELVGNFLTLDVFTNNAVLYDIGFLLRFYFLLLFTFYWIDSSMRTIRDTDPLSRDTLHWSRLRYVVWAINIGIIEAVCVYLATTGNYQITVNTPQGILPAILIFLVPVPLYATGLSGTVALAIGAFRSKDMNLRRQVGWFALSILFFSVLGILAGFTTNSFLQDVLQGSGFLLGGYCLYRSTRALVPLNRRVEEIVTRK